MRELSTEVLHTRLADIVRDDPRMSPVFDRLGLDYCCQGHRTLQEASNDQGVPVSEVIDALLALGPRPEEATDRIEWTDPTALIQHLITTHHRYVREHVSILQGWLAKLAGKHGGRHPELHQVRALFHTLSGELLQHMNKEESILFPFIESLWAAHETGQRAPASPFGTILNPIRAMEREHRDAGDLLSKLRSVTNGYEPPSDGCTTYRACFAELSRFEADLHQHVYLENHVLFPHAIALEGALS
jgi:regulator of cell morphogenesis and NO signaling